MIILGEFAHSGDFVSLPLGMGTSEAASVLSFGAVIYGFATGWTSYAADYTVYQPHTVSRKKIFLWTWLGLIIPLLFTEMLGAALITATGTNPDATGNKYLDGYNASGNGGLLAAVLFPPLGTFGKFCLVILALSIIANNCPNIYSVSLTVQVFGRWTQMVPRFIWTFVATLVYIGISIPGYSHFEIVLENFMVCTYYNPLPRGSKLIPITELHRLLACSLRGHFLDGTFRLQAWNVRLPRRTLRSSQRAPTRHRSDWCFLRRRCWLRDGMSQVWFVGPIAKLLGGEFGGDIGFELGFGFATAAYLAFRPIEKRYFHR